MNRPAAIAHGLVRGTGVLQLLLGISIWFGAATLTGIHMGIGIVFVLALATLAVMGARAAGIALAGFAFLWAVVTVAFGMVQAQILPGPNHWVIRVVHLLIGIVAMGVGDTIGRRIKGGPQPVRGSVPA